MDGHFAPHNSHASRMYHHFRDLVSKLAMINVEYKKCHSRGFVVEAPLLWPALVGFRFLVWAIAATFRPRMRRRESLPAATVAGSAAQTPAAGALPKGSNFY
jgi:hypothetical protein